ncbi:MAG: metalloenzyme [Thermoanaerobaculia bacterium]|nr:metalloenzyme [Thermoanaerobaculia bacterium]
MAGSYHRVLFLFVDGVGVGSSTGSNPLFTTDLPGLERLTGGLWRHGGGEISAAEATVSWLDATLGVEGLPQSATGQTTLFTGVNAAARLGHHVPALPGSRLGALLAEHSLFLRLRQAGRAVTFANPFSPGYLERLEREEIRPSATTLAVRAAGTPLRTTRDLRRGRAVAWDVTGRRFGARAGVDVPVVSPRRAGAILVELARDHHLTLWETFLTDLAGHRRWGVTPEEALEALDGLLEGVLEEAEEDLTVVLTSDHGNVEEMDHRSHTRNPVPLIAWGPGSGALEGLESIAGVAPAIRDLI